MGLVLYNPPDSDFLSSNFNSPDVPGGGEQRYLPSRPGTEGQNPHAKHHRRPLSWSTKKLDIAQRQGEAALLEVHGPCAGSLRPDHPRCNSHLVTLARTNLRLNRRYGRCFRDPSRISRGHIQRSYRQAVNENVKGGYELARSDGLVLPGEAKVSSYRGRRCRSVSRSRSNSPPSLDRQDAFRDPLTTKKRSYRTSLVRAEDVEVRDLYRAGLLYDRDDDEEEERDVKEMYRLGLLYNDEKERGSGFCLDAIVRDEPVYTVSTRPAKRGRRGGGGRKEDWADSEFEELLPLELSYTPISEYPELAEYLKATTTTTTNENDSTRRSHAVLGSSAKRKRDAESPVRDDNQPGPLAVIYELLEDDDYSQEDTTDEEMLMDACGFNNHGNLYGAEVDDDETWAFVSSYNNDDSNDDSSGCDAVGPSMAQKEQQDSWVHVEHHPSGLDRDPAFKARCTSTSEGRPYHLKGK